MARHVAQDRTEGHYPRRASRVRAHDLTPLRSVLQTQRRFTGVVLSLSACSKSCDVQHVVIVGMAGHPHHMRCVIALPCDLVRKDPILLGKLPKSWSRLPRNRLRHRSRALPHSARMAMVVPTGACRAPSCTYLTCMVPHATTVPSNTCLHFPQRHGSVVTRFSLRPVSTPHVRVRQDKTFGPAPLHQYRAQFLLAMYNPPLVPRKPREIGSVIILHGDSPWDNHHISIALVPSTCNGRHIFCVPFLPGLRSLSRANSHSGLPHSPLFAQMRTRRVPKTQSLIRMRPTTRGNGLGKHRMGFLPHISPA